MLENDEYPKLQTSKSENWNFQAHSNQLRILEKVKDTDLLALPYP